MHAAEIELLELRSSRDKAIQAAREAVRDTTRLTRLITILNDSGPLALRLDCGLSTLSELFMADVVVLLNPVGTGSFSPVATVGLPENIARAPFSVAPGSLVKRLLGTGVPFSLDHVSSDQDIDVHLRDVGVETLAGLPIADDDGICGALIVGRCRPESFSDADLGLLNAMAYRIGRTLIESQRSTQFEHLVECSHEIHRYLETDAVAAEAVNRYSHLIGADACALILRDANGDVSCAAHKGLGPPSSASIRHVAHHLIASSLFDKRDVYNLADLTATLTKLSLDPSIVSPLRACLAIPITSKGTLHGILFGFRYAPIAYSFSTTQIATLYAEQVATALENSSLYHAMQSELMERQRLEEEQRKWEHHHQQLQKAKSLQRMAGAIAHHFNNQLSVVMGNLEMALDIAPVDDAHRRFVTAAIQGAERAADVSGLMLTYLGQASGTLVPLNLSDLCRQYVPLLEASASTAARMKIDLPLFGPIISANQNQLQQILTNLVANAEDAVATNQGTVGLAVNTVSPAEIPTAHRNPIDWQPQAKSYACLEIWDTGCGIAEDDVEKIFDPFFSKKSTTRGLGLSVVLGIVKAHDGVITLESEAGRGSSFKVFFPVSVAELPPRVELPPKSMPGNKKITVLLVEDEDEVREMASAMLSLLGATVIPSRDGVEALEIFTSRSDEIHLVMSDVSMPRMGGWETLNAIRTIRTDMPVILVSGFDESTACAGDHPELPQVFLQKPYQRSQLHDALKRAIGR